MVMRRLTRTVPNIVNPHWLTTHLHAYGNGRVNPHSTKPCKPHWLTTHLHAYGNERVNPHSTQQYYTPHSLTTHLHVYGNGRVNPYSTMYYYTPIDLLHIYMPMVMRGLTLTVPSLVNSIDLLHIYMPIVLRGLTLTAPSLVNPHSLNTHAQTGGMEEINNEI